eukprot:GHVR01043508.1.p1 GENE.GHVR01043508.1~~GHVR01043508.1.p1  ORF type:complete len:229 (-),score=22.24 GHVR01043508.1:272-958(-)
MAVCQEPKQPGKQVMFVDSCSSHTVVPRSSFQKYIVQEKQHSIKMKLAQSKQHLNVEAIEVLKLSVRQYGTGILLTIYIGAYIADDPNVFPLLRGTETCIRKQTKQSWVIVEDIYAKEWKLTIQYPQGSPGGNNVPSLCIQSDKSQEKKGFTSTIRHKEDVQIVTEISHVQSRLQHVTKLHVPEEDPLLSKGVLFKRENGDSMEGQDIGKYQNNLEDAVIHPVMLGGK